jgi:hypothetical protein
MLADIVTAMTKMSFVHANNRLEYIRLWIEETVLSWMIDSTRICGVFPGTFPSPDHESPHRLIVMHKTRTSTGRHMPPDHSFIVARTLANHSTFEIHGI